MRVVISQSMLFPWVGLLEQIRLADVFVHYDDVQFSKGSFVNRVQIKTERGMKWMTVPLHQLRLGQSIETVAIAPPIEWKQKHLDLLTNSLRDAPFANDALAIAKEVYESEYKYLGTLARRSMRALAAYFGIDSKTQFIDVNELKLSGAGSERVLAIVRSLGAKTYITGHGAARYLDHESFERAGIAVEYMKYCCSPYPQTHGVFTPYVSALDLVAHCGNAGLKHICSDTISWRSFLNEST